MKTEQKEVVTAPRVEEAAVVRILREISRGFRLEPFVNQVIPA